MKSAAITIEIKGEEVVLLPEKALLLPQRSVLVVADLHLGKATHFQKAGMSIPNAVGKDDLKNLQSIIDEWKPEEVLFLGDVFHSYSNGEWEWLRAFCNRNESIRWKLTVGNHDILPVEKYEELHWETCKIARYGDLAFCHEPDSKLDFAVVGHLHPGYTLRGRGRQSVTLPCFHLTPKLLMMPSFGFFTGCVPQKMTKKDAIYAIAEGEIFPMGAIQ
ncbi:MAG: ligase-associated DNA damage response endonuclease PdeM [Schleiferiaceae bacterium]